MRVKKTVTLTESNVQWLKSTFPGTSLSGFLDGLLNSFRETVDKSPEEYRRRAIEEFIRETNNGTVSQGNRRN